MKLSKHQSINVRICIVFISIVTAIVVVVSVLLTTFFVIIMKERLIADQEIFLQQNKTNVENLVNGFNQISMTLATDTIIADILNQKGANDLERYNSIVKLVDQYAAHANVPLSTSLTVFCSNLYLFDNFEVEEGLLPAKLKIDPQNVNSVYSMELIENEEWTKETIEKNGMIHTFVLPNQGDTIYIARVIKNIYVNNKDYSDSIGIMVIGVSAAQFAHQVEALRLTPNSEVYVVNNASDEQQIIYATDHNDVGECFEKFPKLASIKDVEVNKNVQIGNESFSFMKYETYWDWDIVSLVPYSDVFNEIKPVIILAVIISLIGILIGIVVIAIVSVSVTKPLIRLARTMKTIDKQNSLTDYDKCHFKRNDEVAVLYEAFHKMMKKIQQSMKEVYESGVKQKEMELLALQAQINPHFVYNALDSINWIAMCNGNDDIVEIVTSLADIMRYSIKNPNEQVHLKEELLHVENYVRIQMKQSQYPIDIEIDISQKYSDLIMPKFLIEPLVENAVLHGFKNILQDGKIMITCEEEENAVVIKVSDNGAGADVDVLNRYMAGEFDHIPHSDGFGIRNINDRIQLNYGMDYGLTFEINEGKGLTAKIRLPLPSPNEGIIQQ